MFGFIVNKSLLISTKTDRLLIFHWLTIYAYSQIKSQFKFKREENLLKRHQQH